MTKFITDTPTAVAATSPNSARPTTDDGDSPKTRPNSLAVPEQIPPHKDLGTGGPGLPHSDASGSDGPGRLTIVPVALRTARAFIAWSHRHLLPPRSANFALGVSTEDGTLVGVVIAGRPTAHVFDDGFTIEITRLATDGTPNACSALLGAAWRAAKAMGYRRLIAYTRADEPGTSLHAAGLHRAVHQGWSATSRPRVSNGADDATRTLWEITAGTLGGAR
ncbi:XF1762 family protein [Nonomuraea sp. NPDC051941]|uniref:XF1762 family protein n=1 Tax=Nonomuraea sp. NPDC051941 TaxID=3364373 RepID=UPI0037C5EA1F